MENSVRHFAVPDSGREKQSACDCRRPCQIFPRGNLRNRARGERERERGREGGREGERGREREREAGSQQDDDPNAASATHAFLHAHRASRYYCLRMLHDVRVQLENMYFRDGEGELSTFGREKENKLSTFGAGRIITFYPLSRMTFCCRVWQSDVTSRIFPVANRRRRRLILGESNTFPNCSRQPLLCRFFLYFLLTKVNVNSSNSLLAMTSKKKQQRQ